MNNHSQYSKNTQKAIEDIASLDITKYPIVALVWTSGRVDDICYFANKDREEIEFGSDAPAILRYLCEDFAFGNYISEYPEIPEITNRNSGEAWVDLHKIVCEKLNIPELLLWGTEYFLINQRYNPTCFHWEDSEG